MMVQDFAEAVPRPVRDILGQTRLPSMQGTGGIGTLSATSSSDSGSSGLTFATQSFTGQSFNSASGSASGSVSALGSGGSSSGASLVDLTRTGWSNTAGQQRSTLQRVSYALVGDVLKRSYQVNLDTVQGNKPIVQDLLTGVKGVQLRYLDSNQSWQNQWPENTTIQNGSTADWQSRPVAVEIIVQFKDWGAIRRLVEVSG
jgi:type II secretion system protein J